MNTVLMSASVPAGASVQAADAARQNSAAASRLQRQAPTTESELRKDLHIGILQASIQVSIRSGDQSQALLLRSAIEGINEALAPTLGPQAIQNSMDQDRSAEATAGRIVSMSTAFFEAYAARRQDDAPETVLRDFIDVIRGGFESGFGEAREILEGLGVFKGAVEADVMKTRELVLEGYDRFIQERLPAAAEPQ
ncbi:MULTISPECIES: DUF5610 domain-containing protein [Thauera]|jgi:hypothetical protein|uniref:DUF5610 domain-containing protein n=2 Tax=Thauera aminoaromatica TaxID=164330 RepID=N6YZH0_THASP|nr:MULTISPECIES: DUF5610 domain-containing protein [Thauera]MDA0236365.1 DUF5610 domain-containing protein [Pseudomonadota bacterium]TMW74651.1 hypothetical protein FG147_06625 [Thauera sp. UPWRP]ACK54763.1 conserved hypothetical protein [Thauera aminoaromatica]ENO87533.1 hypothetical protein C665_04641 [Thauera aminoaromatica S2]MBP6132152.1 DUF5610 domain-containing protein [Thauera sp.]